MLFRNLAAALLSLATATPVLADQLCRSVDVQFRNDTDRIIRVLSFEYFDDEDDRWRTENVRDTTINPGRTSSATNETLEYVGNEALTEFRVWYRSCSIASGNSCDIWSRGRRLSEDVAGIPQIERCRKNDDLLIPVEGF